MAYQDIYSFDAWAAVFARKSRDYEVNVAGQVVMKERFRHFIKVPELAAFYNEVTDYKTAGDVGLERPNMNVQLVNVAQTEDHRDFSKRLLDFAQSGNPESIFRLKLSNNEEKAKMLIVTNLGKKCSLSPLLVYPGYSESDDTKIGYAAKNIADYYHRFDEQKGTQFVFCDMSTAKKGEWSAYQELKDRLVGQYGIPEKEIAFIQDAGTEKKKKDYIAKMNKGDIRIMVGSTTMLGTGVNAQEKAVAIHHLDLPWRPSDMEQRNGRGVRQGNKVAPLANNNNVDVFVYAVEKSLDSYNFYLLQAKSEFIRQLKTGALGKRSFDEGEMDEENGMTYGKFLSIISGNTDLEDREKLEKQVLALESERKAFNKEKNNLTIKLHDAMHDLEHDKSVLEALNIDKGKLDAVAVLGDDGYYVDDFTTEDGVRLSVEDQGRYLQDQARRLITSVVRVGNVCGFPVMMRPQSVEEKDTISYKGNIFYVEGSSYGEDRHIFYRHNNGHVNLSFRKTAAEWPVQSISLISKLISHYAESVVSLEKSIPELERIAQKEWPKAEELSEKRLALHELELKIQNEMDSVPMPVQEKKEEEADFYTIEQHQYRRKPFELKFDAAAYPYLRRDDYSDLEERYHGDFRNYINSDGFYTAEFQHKVGAECFVKEVVRLSNEHKDDVDWLVGATQAVYEDCCLHSYNRLKEMGLDRFGHPLEDRQRSAVDVVAMGRYDDVRLIAHGMKEGGNSVLEILANAMSKTVKDLSEQKNIVLVPVPSRDGGSRETYQLCRRISSLIGVEVFDHLRSTSHDSFYTFKKEHPGEPLPDLFVSVSGDYKLPDGAVPVLVDNVLDTGHTMLACLEAFDVTPMVFVVGATADDRREQSVFNVRYVDDGIKMIDECIPVGVGFSGLTKDRVSALISESVGGDYSARRILKENCIDYTSGYPSYLVADVIKATDDLSFEDLFTRVKAMLAEGSIEKLFSADELSKLSDDDREILKSYFRLYDGLREESYKYDRSMNHSFVCCYDILKAKAAGQFALSPMPFKEESVDLDPVRLCNEIEAMAGFAAKDLYDLLHDEPHLVDVILNRDGGYDEKVINSFVEESLIEHFNFDAYSIDSGWYKVRDLVVKDFRLLCYAYVVQQQKEADALVEKQQQELEEQKVYLDFCYHAALETVLPDKKENLDESLVGKFKELLHRAFFDEDTETREMILRDYGVDWRYGVTSDIAVRCTNDLDGVSDADIIFVASDFAKQKIRGVFDYQQRHMIKDGQFNLLEWYFDYAENKISAGDVQFCKDFVTYVHIIRTVYNMGVDETIAKVLSDKTNNGENLPKSLIPYRDLDNDQVFLQNHSEEECWNLRYQEGETFEHYLKRNGLRSNDRDSLLYFHDKYDAVQWLAIEGILSEGLNKDNADDLAHRISALDFIGTRVEAYSVISLLKKIDPEAVLPYMDGVSDYFDKNRPERLVLLKQFDDLKAKHPDAMLLFRCGDYYEIYEKDAVMADKILGVAHSYRPGKTGFGVDNPDGAILTFPHHALDIYLPKLVRAGQRVAICDQLEDLKLSKESISRGITELVEPGFGVRMHLIDDMFETRNILSQDAMLRDALIERMRGAGIKINTDWQESERILKSATLSHDMSLKASYYENINEVFNHELELQISGKLPKGYVYRIGMPSPALEYAGIPVLPIEMAASRLSDKSMQDNHPFELDELYGLAGAIQDPLAVFRSATHFGSNVILTELKHGERNFIVAIETNRQFGNITINSVRSVHYRTGINILNWINDGLGDYFCDRFEEKYLEPLKKELLSKPQYNSADVREQLDSAAKIIKDIQSAMERSEKIREQREIFADFDKKDSKFLFEEHFNGIQNEYNQLLTELPELYVEAQKAAESYESELNAKYDGDYHDKMSDEEDIRISTLHGEMWKLEPRDDGYDTIAFNMLAEKYGADFILGFDHHEGKLSVKDQLAAEYVLGLREERSDTTRQEIEQTDDFKNWFGDWQNDPKNASKIIGEDGRPMILYHGTGVENAFTAFDREKSGRSNELAKVGFWFTPSEDFAKNWEKEVWYTGRLGGRVIPVYLDIKNPKIYRPLSIEAKAEAEKVHKELSDIRQELKVLHSEYNYVNYKYEDVQTFIIACRNGFVWNPDDKYSSVKSQEESDRFREYHATRSEYGRQAIEDGEKFYSLSQKERELEDQYHRLAFADSYEQYKIDLYEMAGMRPGDACIGGLGMAINEPRKVVDAFRDKLKAEGYDGIIIEDTKYDRRLAGSELNTQYIVFEPNQIKSATQNIGTFLRKNPDIRYFYVNDDEGDKRTVYGFVHDSTIYIDPRIATAETPLHEYTHLWAEVLRQRNSTEWNHIVEMMKDTPELWDYVRKNYSHLKSDDEIADEALALFSGRHGYERLRSFAEGCVEPDTILGKVAEMLEQFWHAVADFLHIHYASKEQVADQILKDLLDGVNPMEYLKEGRQQTEGKAFKEWFGDWEKAHLLQHLDLDKMQELHDAIKRALPRVSSWARRSYDNFVSDMESKYGDNWLEHLTDKEREEESNRLAYCDRYDLDDNDVNELAFDELKDYYDKRLLELVGHSDGQLYALYESDEIVASKVVDADGRPLVVEHGTNAEFSVFDKGMIGSTSKDDGLFGYGFYFGTQAPGWLGAKHIMKVYLDIKVPFEVSDGVQDIYTEIVEKMDTLALSDLVLKGFNGNTITVGSFIKQVRNVDLDIAKGYHLRDLKDNEEYQVLRPCKGVA